jgi:hypothetical protein
MIALIFLEEEDNTVMHPHGIPVHAHGELPPLRLPLHSGNQGKDQLQKVLDEPGCSWAVLATTVLNMNSGLSN